MCVCIKCVRVNRQHFRKAKYIYISNNIYYYYLSPAGVSPLRPTASARVPFASLRPTAAPRTDRGWAPPGFLRPLIKIAPSQRSQQLA